MPIGLALLGLGALVVAIGSSGSSSPVVDGDGSGGGPKLPTVKKPTASRVGWVRMQDSTGLAVRAPDRSWTSPAVRQLLQSAGKVAAALGGSLQLGDVGPSQRGSAFSPHKSHRWGRDMDIAYTLEAFPTPDDVAVDPRVVEVLERLTPWIDVVGVNALRAPAFVGRSFKVLEWDGHNHHLHLRLKSALVDEPQAFMAMQGFALGDDQEDD